MSNTIDTRGPSHGVEEHPEKLVDLLIARTTAEFEAATVSVDRAKELSSELAELLLTAPIFPDPSQLDRLVSLLGKRTGAVVEPLFNLLTQLAWRIDDPWIVLKGMLNVSDRALMGKALDQTFKLTEAGKLLVDLEVLDFIAISAEKEANAIQLFEHLEILGNIVQLAALPLSDPEQDPLVWLYLSSCRVPLRRLAARILDAGAKTVSPELARVLLDEEASQIAAPQFPVTRATHLDLLNHLIPIRTPSPS